MSQPRYLVVRTGASLADIEPQVALLRGLGAELVQRPCASEDELIATVRDADVIMNSVNTYNSRVIGALNKCRAIIEESVGYEIIDVEAATAHDVMVANLPDINIEEVSEHALALILACARRIVPFHLATRHGAWGDVSTRRLRFGDDIRRLNQTTLGIVGFGNIGRLVARKASGLWPRILAADPFVSAEFAARHGATLVPLDELLRESDFVTLHVLLNRHTRGLIGASELALMKPTAFLVNTCRGPIVDEAALIAALRERRLAGAGLDVFEVEPTPADNPLLHMENVVVSPHIAGASMAATADWLTKSFAEAARVLRGHWPLGLINRELRARLPYTDEL